MAEKEKKDAPEETEQKRWLRFSLPSPKQFLSRKLLSRKVLIPGLIVGNLIALLSVAGLYFRGQSPSEETVETTAAPEVESANGLHLLAQGDTAMSSGRYQQAAEFYQAAGKTNLPNKGLIAYRLGVCAEFDHRLDDAIKHYQNANQQDFSETSLAALLGAARILYKQKQFDVASQSLAYVAAIKELPVLAQTQLRSKVLYAHALTVAAQTTQGLPKSPTATAHLFTHQLNYPLEEVLALVPLDAPPVAMPRPVGDNTRSGVTLQYQGQTPFDTLIACHIANIPATGILEELARVSSWKISITPTAHETMAAKRTFVQLNGKTAAEVLSLVLEPLRLFWSFEDDTLVIDRMDNFNRDFVLTRQIRRGNALLLDALAESPGDPLAPEAYLALGNLAAIDQKKQRAETYYQDLQQRYPQHSATHIASFNLAKARFIRQDYRPASELFYEVADTRGLTEIRALAFLYLGRLHLNNGEIKPAKRALSRSIAMTSDPDVRAHAATTLASAYLIRPRDNGYTAANAVLMESRDRLQQPPYANVAVFLSALTRYRHAIRPGEVARRTKELISATVKVKPKAFFGEFGYLLIGDAFAELNFTSEAQRVYEEGIRNTRGNPMHGVLLYRVATELRKRDDLEAAAEALEELAQTDSPWASTASIELAEIMMRDADFERCIQHCRRSLLQGYPEASQAKLLAVLGRAYEELGRHEQASLCFAGFLPASSPTSTGESLR